MKRARRFRLPRGPRETLIWVSAALIVTLGGAGGFMVGNKRFSSERAAAGADLQTYQEEIAKTALESADHKKIGQSLLAIIDRTLGSDLQSTDSALRSRLNRIGEDIRLADVRVSTGTATKRQTPARKSLARPKDPRDLDDFVELPATITGEGTIEQSLALVHRIDVEPWIKRIDSVRLEELKDGDRIKTTVKLTTLWMQDKRGKGDLKPSETALASFERLRPIVASNPFRVPKAAAPVPAVAAAQPAPIPVPTGFPYEQWKLTGIVSGPLGAEAWINNTATGEHRQLTPGQQLGDAVFIGYEQDIAEFKQGEQRFKVQVGRAMSERNAVPVS